MKTLFVSDIHLGCKHAQSSPFLRFINAYEPERLYIVGDFIDGWKLRRNWRWDAEYSQIFARLRELADAGTELYYTPGNHDDFLRKDMFLRKFLDGFGFMQIAEEFVHETIDGRQFLVLHGDRFDFVETGAKWMSVVASIGYDAILSANRMCKFFQRRESSCNYAFSAALKRHVKQAVQFISNFEGALMDYAAEQRCDGVICGHIHTPTIARKGNMTYCNTGDWVEHCSALVEYADGRLEIVYYSPEQYPQAIDSTPSLAEEALLDCFPEASGSEQAVPACHEQAGELVGSAADA